MINKTTWTDSASIQYHLNQWDNPKESTKEFEKFISKYLVPGTTIIDIGCGAGAATAYLANKHPEINFIGIDYEKELVELAIDYKSKKNIKNLFFECGDIFNINSKKNIHGVISLQTISWIDNFEKPLEEIIEKLNPKWISMTGLFYEGDITCRIEVEEFIKNSRKVFYNTYSIPSLNRYCKTLNYEISKYLPFEISIDLIKPNNNDILGTYTEKIIVNEIDFKRIQISGPLLMNWYTILINKIN